MATLGVPNLTALSMTGTESYNVYQSVEPRRVVRFPEEIEMRPNVSYGELNSPDAPNAVYTVGRVGPSITSNKCTKILFILVAGLLIAFALLCVVVFAAVFSEISALQRQEAVITEEQESLLTCSSSAVSATVGQIQALENLSRELDIQLMQARNEIAQLSAYLEEAVRQLSRDVVEVENRTLGAVEDFNTRLVGISSLFPASSCAALFSYYAPSGYYWVRASNGSAVRVYCDMTRTCGGVTGGWMRVGYLDMTDASQQCPSGLRQHIDSDLRTCGIDSDLPQCSSVIFDSHTMPYSRVCGRIIGYQFRGTDAFRPREGSPRPPPQDSDIDSNYVDGISLTCGSPMRHHLWTFAAGLGENFQSAQRDQASACPCSASGSVGTNPPAFVGNDYFCETGNRFDDRLFTAYYTSDPLWDGAGCGSCCNFTSATPPWFHKQLPQPATDDIEMRVCSDEVRSDEDVRIEMIEIFVQ